MVISTKPRVPPPSNVSMNPFCFVRLKVFVVVSANKLILLKIFVDCHLRIDNLNKVEELLLSCVGSRITLSSS